MGGNMKINKISNIYQLAFFRHVFPINCYLIDETQGLTLIDTGMGFCKNGILKEAKKLGKPITKIILTHPHVDHIGSLDSVKNEYPGASVYVSARDARLMNGDFSLNKTEPKLRVKGGFNSKVKTKPDVLMNTGNMIGSLKVIAAPGHTPGSIVLYQQTSKTLFAGDTMVTHGGIFIAGGGSWIFPFSAKATWDKELAIKSMESINKLPIEWLMVRHGKLINHANSKIGQAIQHAKAALSV